MDRDRFSKIRSDYAEAFARHGDSPAALFWPKGRQHARFEALVASFLSSQSGALTLCDFGCGLGHLQQYLEEKYPGKIKYTGLDMVPELVEEAVSKGRNVRLIHHDEDAGHFDMIVCSGVFNLKYYDDDNENEEYVLDRVDALLRGAAKYFACDFMRPDVDFKQDGAWHQSYDSLVSRLTQQSRDVELIMRALPYEYTARVYKDV